MYSMFVGDGHNIDLSSYSCEALRNYFTYTHQPDSFWPHTDNTEGNYYIDAFDNFSFDNDPYIDVHGSVADSTFYTPISTYMGIYSPDMDACEDYVQRVRYTGATINHNSTSHTYYPTWCPIGDIGTGVGDWTVSPGLTGFTMVAINRRQSNSYWNIVCSYTGRYGTWSYGGSTSPREIQFQCIHDYPNATYPWGSVQVNMSCDQSYLRVGSSSARSSGGLNMTSAERFRPDPLGNGGGTPGTDWVGFTNSGSPVLWIISPYWEINGPISALGSSAYGEGADDTGGYCARFGYKIWIGWPEGLWSFSLDSLDDGIRAAAPVDPDRFWFDPYVTYLTNYTRGTFRTHYNAFQMMTAWYRNTVFTDAQANAVYQQYLNNFQD